MKRRFDVLISVLFAVISVSMSAQTNAAARPGLSVREEKSLLNLLAGKSEFGRGLNFYSREDEKQMGDEAELDIEETSKIFVDEGLTKYLEQVGRRLADQSSARGEAFRFRVIESDEVNAVALPNGVVYVNTGLLIASESEAELASVLAHEVAHVAGRHASKAASRRGLWGAASLGMAIFGGGVGAAVQPAVGMASGGLAMKFSRDAEREADVYGLRYIYGAGYDPQAFVRFLTRMNHEPSKKPGWLARMNATHPETEERIRRAVRVIELSMPERESIDDTSDFIEARQKVIERTHPEAVSPDRPVLKIVRDSAVNR